MTTDEVGAENVEVVRRSLTDWDSFPDLLTEDLVWHFYGDVEGIDVDHHGRDNVSANLWAKLFEASGGAFAVAPVSISAAGDELVTAHVKVTIAFDTPPIDAVVVYRMRDGRIAEAWDVPGTIA